MHYKMPIMCGSKTKVTSKRQKTIRFFHKASYPGILKLKGEYNYGSLNVKLLMYMQKTKK